MRGMLCYCQGCFFSICPKALHLVFSKAVLYRLPKWCETTHYTHSITEEVWRACYLWLRSAQGLKMGQDFSESLAIYLDKQVFLRGSVSGPASTHKYCIVSGRWCDFNNTHCHCHFGDENKESAASKPATHIFPKTLCLMPNVFPNANRLTQV